ncbi:hypothetical protein B9Z55_000863 [Caenorhabditis nigoni]|uniref:Uncharacterized protein n=1 Tax=Caenorhabditis nigoni TaxID=1611254 RepID=A0A2G5VV99_9PELO|nr:hypothetical protein B9Z55_000863 [Caenorhabditis nigoni]
MQKNISTVLQENAETSSELLQKRVRVSGGKWVGRNWTLASFSVVSQPKVHTRAVCTLASPVPLDASRARSAHTRIFFILITFAPIYDLNCFIDFHIFF